MVNKAINTSPNEGAPQVNNEHLPLTTHRVHKKEVRQIMLLTYIIPRSS